MLLMMLELVLGRTHLVEGDEAEDFQLLVQVLAIRAHPLAELKAALHVGGVDEVVHVQHLLGLASGQLLTVLQQLRYTARISGIMHCHGNVQPKHMSG